jgi:hypothetical protein
MKIIFPERKNPLAAKKSERDRFQRTRSAGVFQYLSIFIKHAAANASGGDP